MSISITSNGKHIVMPYHAGLFNLVPHARELTHNGDRLLVMPNGDQEARLARNLGMPVPPPIMSRYDWNGHDAWDVQRRTAATMVDNDRAFILNAMGTGKTLAALFAIDWLQKEGAIGKALVTAPLSTLTPVWAKEIWRYFPNKKFVVLYGSRKKRMELLREDADIYVVNHHGLIMLAKELAEKQFGAFVIDELAVFRNNRTDLWKAANFLCSGIPRVWGLTGSPTPKAPTDAWAQVRLLTPGRVGKSFVAFRERTMVKATNFLWRAKPEAVQLVKEAMSPAVRYTRDDVMELPPTTYTDREVPLTPVAKSFYETMVKKARSTGIGGQPVTAANEGVLHSKLLQVSLGWVYADDRTVLSLPNAPRLDALSEVLEESDRKVIVFVPFIHALQGVVSHLEKNQHDVVQVHGGVPIGARNRIFTAFQNDPNSAKILVAHPKCMAHGLTLTEADTIVWFSPTPDLEVYEQANARITRPGQKHKTLILHLAGTPVEKLTYRRLRERAKLQGILLELFAQQESAF